jgi:hypothetical protein
MYIYIKIRRVAGEYNKSLGMGQGLQETTNLQEQYAHRASLLFFQAFSFILNNDLRNPFPRLIVTHGQFVSLPVF